MVKVKETSSKGHNLHYVLSLINSTRSLFICSELSCKLMSQQCQTADQRQSKTFKLKATQHLERGVGAGGDKNKQKKRVFICREVCVCARVLGNRRVGWVTVL